MSSQHVESGLKPASTEAASRVKVSLIVATWNRVAELERLLASLDGQTYRKFEVIIVDQNPDDRLALVLHNHPALAIRRLRSEMGASRARNVGLRVAEGEIIAFPDDDCWYPDQLLACIVLWFDQHADFDGLFTAIRNPDNKTMTPKFPPPEGPCTKTSILRCGMAANAFLRTRAVRAAGFFREDIGPGTSSPYQSGEDLDYIVRPLEHGLPMWYQPGFAVYHPDLKSRERLRRTTYPYAMGVGYFWRLHGYPWWWCLKDILLRSVGGAVFHLLKGDIGGSRIYLARAAGQLRGYLSVPRSQPQGRADVQPMTDDHA
jgi:glycosyltransferase involved in cell wall biosynthesis